MRITLDDLHSDLPPITKWAMLYHHFRAGGVVGADILAAFAEEYNKCKAAAGKVKQINPADIPADIPAGEPATQLETDLAAFRRYCRENGYLRQFIKGDGSPNISAVCRAIGVAPGGAGWQRGLDVVAELQRRATKAKLHPPTKQRTWGIIKAA